MINWQRQAQSWLAERPPAVLVEVMKVRGSTPREEGAWMLVGLKQSFGSIGGGQLELRAIEEARRLLSSGSNEEKLWDLPLGPELGQCCGGHVRLRLVQQHPDTLLQRLNACFEEGLPLFLFGGGHVAQALLPLLQSLNFDITLIDSRQEVVAQPLKQGVTCRISPFPWLEVDMAPPATIFLVMTHDHDQDFEICREVLQRPDLRFLGLIGSQSKRARFEKRLANTWLGGMPLDLSRLVCPVGLEGVGGKQPVEIAVSIAAQLLKDGLNKKPKG